MLTEHALEAMARRRLSAAQVARVLAHPEQMWELRSGRWVLQSRSLHDFPPRVYLIRVIVDLDREPPDVVTVYRTSKVGKYWRRDA